MLLFYGWRQYRRLCRQRQYRSFSAREGKERLSDEECPYGRNKGAVFLMWTYIYFQFFWECPYASFFICRYTFSKNIYKDGSNGICWIYSTKKRLAQAVFYVLYYCCPAGSSGGSERVTSEPGRESGSKLPASLTGADTSCLSSFWCCLFTSLLFRFSCLSCFS